MINGKKAIAVNLTGEGHLIPAAASWDKLFDHLNMNDWVVRVKRMAGPENGRLRNAMLEYNPDNGQNQLPFGGRFDYDYVLWIDADAIYTPEHFEQLLSHDLDIVSCLTVRYDGEMYANLFYHDELKSVAMNHLPEGSERLIEVPGTGMHFTLIKYGVYEKIDKRWYFPMDMELEDGSIVPTGSDIMFCNRAHKAGFKVYVDTECKVGHLKYRALYADRMETP